MEVDGGVSMSRLVKRSFALAGHRTSVALEPEFWSALSTLAVSHGLTVGRLVAQVDAAREGAQPLASALRVHALQQVQLHPAPLRQMEA